MAQAKVVREPITPVSHDLDKAYELGKLSGEVRNLKWGVGVALVAMLGSMGVLYEGIDDVRVELIEIRRDISGFRGDMVGIRKDVDAVEEDVAEVKGDAADLDTM